MSSLLSIKFCRADIFPSALFCLAALLVACSDSPWNDPYPKQDDKQAVLYMSFAERPKHLDPAVAYSENEYAFIAQIYEPPLQYHYLKRPYQLTPLAAARLPDIRYYDRQGHKLGADADPQDIAYSDYLLEIKPGIRFQPHPAFAQDKEGRYRYHHLDKNAVDALATLNDFAETGTRELTAEDYVYQIKRLAYPKTQSPIAEMMKNYIVGFDDFAKISADKSKAVLKTLPIAGVEALDRYHYRIRIKGKYPQFSYWLAMPFFAPMPWEADAFYDQPGFSDKNITLDWYPVGTGPYFLAENNPNRRMMLVKNPNFHFEAYPSEGESGDAEKGLLADAGKPLPFIDKVVVTLEKETIPNWSKFLQGYYDSSGIASDSFDQAIQFTGGGVTLTDSLKEKGIRLYTSVETSIFYMGFNMLDATVGGDSDQTRKLRQAIAIAIDYEEFIAIFRNERGVPAQGAIPPGIFGNEPGEAGINSYVYDWVDGKPRRKSIETARKLIAEAGYPNGVDPKTKEPMILYFDTTATSVDDKPLMSWYRKQFQKLGIQLVIRATDYNRFQQKMSAGNAQIYVWGWNADYPDPENFFALLYGFNGKVKHSGENSGNYQNPEFDRLFEQMRNMENGEQRLQIIRQMQAIIRRDAPWVFGFHPKTFSLYHSWASNLKPNLMANNRLKYVRIDPVQRAELRKRWNRPVFWPLAAAGVLVALLFAPAVQAYRRRAKRSLPAALANQTEVLR
ncbi:ABC transporter substrate-binding protein [Methylomicrobium sp. Wu6]|uniref:ABC transporter substrate-binding protein n=1 Tax=Methylomicrobium sp. Wu6 TaxID=3107928 RepID=UPI002DD668C4|nr:ABC transporter substrate-binding protein [Methylomicrobium sp. Wu6]MEC4749916.1 ABC transporter substrate-binding protein [Methylomicrobium sp. Wu6]